jgi:hypothetical protein
MVESLSKLDTASTKAFCINYAQRLTTSTLVQIIAAASELGDNTGRYTVCIVENIAPEHIEALGSAWDLDPAFFVQYASDRQREHLWMPDVLRGDRPRTDRKPYDHIDGNFESLKSVFKHGWQRSLLFSHEDHLSRAFPAPPLCYMLSNSVLGKIENHN